MSLLTYCNALPNKFVGYDDDMLVLENEPIRQGRVGYILCRPLKGTYLPLRALSYAADYALFGTRPFGYHLTNVLLHTLNSMLALLVLRALGLGRIAALAAAGVFAVHAVHTEAVSWIAGRRDVLFAFFFLLAFLCYVRFRRRGSRTAYTGALAAFLLSCLSKGTAIAFFPTIVALDWRLGRVRRGRVWTYAKGVLPFLLITGVALAAHVYMGGRSGAIRAYHAGSFGSAMHAMAGVLASYARLLLLPIHLCASYYFDPGWLPAWPYVVAGIGLVAAGLVFAARWQRPGFWVWWLLLNLLPVLNFVPLSTLKAERYLYVPSLSFAVLLGWAVSRAAWRSQFAGVALCSILICQVALTCRRNGDWRDAASLWRSSLLACPGDPKGIGSLALIAQSAGQTARAEAGYLRALRLNPALPRSHLNLGSLYAARGRDDLAKERFQQALKLKPDHVKAHVNLGLLLLRQGRVVEAKEHARRAMATDPSFRGSIMLDRMVRGHSKGEAPRP